MRRCVALWMIVLTVGCAASKKEAPPPPVKIVEPKPPQPDYFVHVVEWRGQTLGEIARWYTGKYENWKKLARPVNPDLERCCASLQVGRKVSIPRELVVRMEPMPKPQLKTRPAKPLVKAEPPAAPLGEAPSEEPPPATPLGEAPSEAPPPPAPLSEAPSASSGPASGEVTFKGPTWQVVDAIAYPADDDTVEVALSSKPLNRKEFAKDGKVDTFDVMKHRMTTDASTLTLRIPPDGQLNCIDYSTDGGGGSSCGSAQSEGFRLGKRSDDAVSGSLAFADGSDKVDVRFDVPITRVVKRAGSPLPAGGGDPGKAVLATFAANLTGDFEKIKAVHPPEKLKQMEAALTDAQEKKMMLEFIKDTTPSKAKIVGGTVDGDAALVDFTGKSEGKTVKGTAEVQRIDGKWYVDSVSTKE